MEISKINDDVSSNGLYEISEAKILANCFVPSALDSSVSTYARLRQQKTCEDQRRVVTLRIFLEFYYLGDERPAQHGNESLACACSRQLRQARYSPAPPPAMESTTAAAGAVQWVISPGGASNPRVVVHIARRRRERRPDISKRTSTAPAVESNVGSRTALRSTSSSPTGDVAAPPAPVEVCIVGLFSGRPVRRKA